MYVYNWAYNLLYLNIAFLVIVIKNLSSYIEFKTTFSNLLKQNEFIVSLSILQIVDEALLIIIHVSLVYRVDIKSGSGNGCKYISIADIS